MYISNQLRDTSTVRERIRIEQETLSNASQSTARAENYTRVDPAAWIDKDLVDLS